MWRHAETNEDFGSRNFGSAGEKVPPSDAFEAAAAQEVEVADCVVAPTANDRRYQPAAAHVMEASGGITDFCLRQLLSRASQTTFQTASANCSNVNSRSSPGTCESKLRS